MGNLCSSVWYLLCSPRTLDHQGSPHNKLNSQFGAEFLPCGGLRGPAQHLSHVFLTLSPQI